MPLTACSSPAATPPPGVTRRSASCLATTQGATSSPISGQPL